MPQYEVMFIVQPDLDGEAQEEAINRVKEVIEKEKGEIISLKKMGKRKLAYEIEDFREGFYVVIEFEASREVVPALDHFFKVKEGYLRHLIIRQEEKKGRVARETVAGKEQEKETQGAEKGAEIQSEAVEAEKAPEDSATKDNSESH